MRSQAFVDFQIFTKFLKRNTSNYIIIMNYYHTLTRHGYEFNFLKLKTPVSPHTDFTLFKESFHSLISLQGDHCCLIFSSSAEFSCPLFCFYTDISRESSKTINI